MIERFKRGVVCAAMSAMLTLVLGPTPSPADEPGAGGVVPQELPGLVAHYDEATLHRKLRDGEPVRRWPDAGPHGHDLVEARTGLPSIFRTVQIEGRPAVVVGKQASFDVEPPFTLDDHTFVLVYASNATRRALLSDPQRSERGIVIDDSRARDYLQGPGGRAFYSIARARDDSFRILVLGRRDGVLRAFVNGENVSTGYHDAAPLPVGRLFAIDHSKAVRSDGHGLRIAQLVVYDRYLEDDERNALVATYGARYGIDVVDGRTVELEDEVAETVYTWPESKVLLRVASSATIDLSTPASAVPWDRATRVRAPLHHDASVAPERIGSLDDGQKVWISALLVAAWQDPAPEFRVLLLADGTRYLEQSARPRRVERDDGTWLETRIEAELTLDAGSTIELIVVGESGGLLELDPASRLLATTAPPTPFVVPLGTGGPR